MTVQLHTYEHTHERSLGKFIASVKMKRLPNAGYDDIVYLGKSYLVQKIVHDIDKQEIKMYLQLWS